MNHLKCIAVFTVATSLLLAGCERRVEETVTPVLPSITPTIVSTTTTPAPWTPAQPSSSGTRSKYGLDFKGEAIADSRIAPVVPEYFNGDMQLIVFYTPNLIGDMDRHVALYDWNTRQIVFVADLATSAGEYFWTGWLRNDTFYIANNHNLVTYDISGNGRKVITFTNKMHTIHGVAWSQGSLTMAVMQCDNDTDDIDLVLLNEQMTAIKRLPKVDKREQIRGPGGAFPWQRSVMAWDLKGERLGFTKTGKQALAIYESKTDTIQDIQGIIQVKMIQYDPVSQQFLTLRP